VDVHCNEQQLEYLHMYHTCMYMYHICMYMYARTLMWSVCTVMLGRVRWSVGSGIEFQLFEATAEDGTFALYRLQ